MSAFQCSLAVFLAFLTAFVYAPGARASSDATVNLSAERLNRMPLAFTENHGQWDERVKFRVRAGGVTTWFATDGIYYQFIRNAHRDALTSEDPLRMLHKSLDQEGDSIEQLVIRASFAGANPDVEVVGEGLMEYKCNYFLGNDPSKWHTEVPNYSSILYKGVYPGIDIRFSGERSGRPMYEVIAGPGADLGKVKIEYEGIDELSDDPTGWSAACADWVKMTVATGMKADGTQSPSHSLLQTSESTAGFVKAVSEARQSRSILLTLDYSTYLGGSSSDEGYSIAVDGSGEVYVTGNTLSADFPTLYPYQVDPDVESFDVFITKLSTGGYGLIFSTYLGGGSYDLAWDIALDASGSAYVTGGTSSFDFPCVNPYQGYLGYGDAFISKLTSTEFVSGDTDGSGQVDIDDVTYRVAYIFSGGPAPEPYESGDVDCSGAIDIDDVVYLTAYIFSGGPPPGDPDGDGVPDC